MAVTRHLKMHAPSQLSGLRFPLELMVSTAGRAESVTEDSIPEPAPEPGNPYQAPDGRDLGPESVSAPSQLSGLRFPFELMASTVGMAESMTEERCQKGDG